MTVMAMLDWIADHGLRTIGYTRESYLACPDDRAAWITEIQLPVTKETSPAPQQPTWPTGQPGC